MWYINNKEISDEDIPVDSFGFIYLITNELSGKIYVGKKFLTKASKKVPLIKKDGSISKRKSSGREESNWKNYYGSSKNLTADIKLLGKEKFKREILMFCNSKSTLSYFEVVKQIEYKVLENNNSYNECIKITAYKNNIFNKF